MKSALFLLLVFMALPIQNVLASSATDARFALHLKAAPTKATTSCNTYTPNADGTPCSAYTTTGPAGDYNLIYVVVGHAPATGVTAVSFGIDYNGRDGMQNGIDPQYVTFTICADGLLYGADGPVDFPNPGGTARITWLTCANQQAGGEGVHAIVGSLQVYAFAEDVLRITPAHYDGITELALLECGGEDIVDLLQVYPPQMHDALMGKVHLGGDGSQGYTPCGVVPVAPSSWGRVKALFASP